MAPPASRPDLRFSRLFTTDEDGSSSWLEPAVASSRGTTLRGPLPEVLIAATLGVVKAGTWTGFLPAAAALTSSVVGLLTRPLLGPLSSSVNEASMPDLMAASADDKLSAQLPEERKFADELF